MDINGLDALNTALNDLQETMVEVINAVKSLPNDPPAGEVPDLTAQVEQVEAMTAALKDALRPAEV